MTAVGVVGASARAAVHSLARAGVPAEGLWAVDLFADRDLTRLADCAVCPAAQYPDAIPELVKQFPPGPVLYTGGLENHPHVLRELAAQRELWGNPAEVVERVRDPFRLRDLLTRVGFPAPQLIPPGEPCPIEGRWLRKPLRSAGGLGIRFAQPGEPTSPQHYLQEYTDGAPMSALFVNDAFVGVTEQLIGVGWLHARPFAYCGNIGPIETNSIVRDVGRLLCEQGVRGVWGVDFILRDCAACVLEVNPRYTAGVEVLEHATGAIPLAVGAKRRWEIDGGIAWASGAASAGRPRVVGKAIYYAPHPITFPASGPWDADLAGDFDPWRLPQFADIPAAGSVIEAGSPVLTFFATGTTPAEVRGRLQSRASELDQLFRDSP